MTRRLVGGLGVLVAAYGTFLLLTRQEPDRLVNAAAWLGAGVVLHDLVLAPLVVALLAVASRLLPAAARGPATVGMVVLGCVTLVAVPVLGRFGARPDNPTLLDRDYGTGWLVLAALVWVGVGVATAMRLRRATKGSPTAGRSADGPGAGG